MGFFSFVSVRLLARSAISVLAAAVWLAGCSSDSVTSTIASPSANATPSVTLRAPGFSPSLATMTLTSTTFANGATMPARVAFSFCGGANVSPQLSWTGAPAATLSYIVTEFDVDNASGAGFWHWTIFDIPAAVTALAANAAMSPPAGSIQGYTDFGTSGYSGPCPPVGDGIHHYNFTVLALNEATVPGVTTTSTGAFLTINALAHVIAKGTYVGTYSR